MKGRLTLLLGSVLCGLIVLELGARLLHGPGWLTRWPNLVTVHRNGSASDVARYAVHDGSLGFAPLPDARLLNMTRERDGTIRRANANHDAQGLRMVPAGTSATLSGPAILAAGDSFTYGAEVDDADTWPVALQSILGHPVINAGVNGYGIDQIVLRAEKMSRALRPGVIVIAFIDDDLRRAEMSRVWGADKPYFEVAGEELAVRNVPVPPPDAQQAPLTLWQHLFGRSMLVQMAIQALGLMDAWSHDDLRVHPSGAGNRIACLLMQRLANDGHKLSAKIVVVGLYDADAWRWRWLGSIDRQNRALGATLSCAAKAGIETIDTYDAFDRAISAGGVDAVYHRWHPNAAGNRLIAELIAARLR